MKPHGPDCPAPCWCRSDAPSIEVLHQIAGVPVEAAIHVLGAVMDGMLRRRVRLSLTVHSLALLVGCLAMLGLAVVFAATAVLGLIPAIVRDLFRRKSAPRR